jgi:hypothetical protein
MSDVHTHGSDSANGSLASSPPRRRPARGDLEDDGNIGCADVSTARGIGDRSLLPVPPQRSPNDRRLARPPEPARPAREPNPCSFACLLSRPRRPIKPTSTESEADPVIMRIEVSRRRKKEPPKNNLALLQRRNLHDAQIVEAWVRSSVRGSNAWQTSTLDMR